MPTRLALYVRVSTQDQHPDCQLEPLRVYAKARGLEVVEEYVDHGVSGAKVRRPGVTPAAIRAGEPGTMHPRLGAWPRR